MSRLRVREPVAPMVGPRYGRWVCGVIAIPPLAAVLTLLLAPDPHGHWSEHLWGAYFDIAQLVVLLSLALLLGPRNLPLLLVALLAVVAVGIVLETIGNFQVANSIWGTRGDPGFGSGYRQGHDRAATGDLLVIVGGAAFAVVSGLARRVPSKIAGVGLFMAVIPPWLWPGAGVLMLLLYGLTSKAGFDRRHVGQTATKVAV